MSLIQAMKDDAQEHLDEHEAKKKASASARRKSFQQRDASPQPAFKPTRSSFESGERPHVGTRHASIAATTMGITSAADSSDDDWFGMAPALMRTKEPEPKMKRTSKAVPNIPISPKPGIGPSGKPVPGDLGPKDPRRKSPPSSSKSQSPHGRQRRTSDPPEKKPRRRRASDGALLRRRQNSDEDGRGTRLAEDLDDEDAVGSSEDDYEEDSEDEGTGERGRERERENEIPVVGKHPEEGDKEGLPAAPLSPGITVTPPTTEGAPRRAGVHPHSAYDHGASVSATSSPRNSDDEEHLTELRRAQRLPLTISPIHSTPSAHRVIRQIVRGDYDLFQKEAEMGRRRQRMYLVATDLSPEAEYALEWTIGTVLRDGDTLLAVYAVDDEGGAQNAEGVEIGHGADVVKDTARIVGSLPTERVAQSPRLTSGASPARRAISPAGGGSRVRQPGDTEGMTKAEKARYKAAEDITDRCVKLLRKTRLQIRVVVEVFHCKSPRHMITEVIDFLSPTLTILGSRGRSNLKGVLLGSFSNYLVTKSSTPVMVARRRLRKHQQQALHRDGLPVAGSGDGRMTIGRMSNVLAAPGGITKRVKGLAGAKVD